MRPNYRRCAVSLSIVPLLFLPGCLWTTRKLPVPRMPSVTQTVTPEELVDRLNRRWEQLNSLVATVEIQASVMKTQQGIARDYTSFRGHILMRKPAMLRVLGTYLGMKAFDMASDGERFKLLIPTKGIAYEGPNQVTRKSANTIENMRPDFFLDSIVVRGLRPEDEYTVTADTDTVEDASKKHLFLIREYVLNVIRPNPGSKKLLTVRVIHFHRDDLMPYQEDMYDRDGNLETQVIYGQYANFGNNQYPSTITIKRPLQEYQVVLRVEQVTENMNLKDDQFQLKIPDGTKIQTLR